MSLQPEPTSAGKLSSGKVGGRVDPGIPGRKVGWEIGDPPWVLTSSLDDVSLILR